MTSALTRKNGNKEPGAIELLSVQEKVLIEGDLSVLSPEERIEYYAKVCESAGLNPITRPFLYVTLNGKLTLYPKKDCAEQLRRVHAISLTKPDIQFTDGLILVTITASDRSGKTDTDVGVVAGGNLQGEARANAVMKAVTKAKRRVTFSICGLGFLPDVDEEYVATQQRSLDYQTSPEWEMVLKYFNEADTEEKIARVEDRAYQRVTEGKFPQIARQSIEREALRARDRINAITAGLDSAPTPEPIEASVVDTDDF